MSIPDSPMPIDGLLKHGMEAHRAGRVTEAAAAYRAMLALDAGHPEALCLLGAIAGQEGRHQEAIAFFRQALARAPGNADIHHNIGETYRHLGNLVNADKAFRRAIELRPDHAESYIGLADAIEAEAERLARAGHDKHARELRRVAASALLALARRQHARKLTSTEEHYRRAAALDPKNPDILAAWAAMLCDMGRYSETETIARRVLAIDPCRADALSNLGTALLSLERPGAETAFRAALRLEPTLAAALTGLSTLTLMGPLYRSETTPRQIFEAHRDWGQRMIAAAGPEATRPPAFANEPDPLRRLRVGYVSPDFRNHVVAQFAEPLLSHHDATQVESFCYADVGEPDERTERFKALAGRWRSITGVSDAEFRRQVRSDRIDILVDLAGYTTGSRLAAFAVKPAPVTATWLGYPATTGLSTIDWRITDGLADPPGAEEFHTERLMRLPEGFLCYQPLSGAGEVAPLPALAAGRVTFGSANNLVKVTPEVVALWSRLLHAVPDARLILRAHKLADPVLRARYRDLFAGHGVAGDRVDLRPWIFARDGHLTAYREIDIALDPFPYNGTTTTCDALWMGVPVVSLVGDRHAARVGASLLSRVGLAHLAAPDEAGYIDAAARLAADLPALARLRAALRERVAASPLSDGAGFAQAMEAAFRAMWLDWCEGRS